MFKDFENVKSQLSQLAEIVNSFKSEAVQLRIIDLLFKGAIPQDEPAKKPVVQPNSKRRSGRAASAAKSAGEENQNKKAAGNRGRGPRATVSQLHANGFFATPRTLNDIIEHCEINLARRIKQNEISGKLARMVSDEVLKRTKNADGQYEYTNP
jgi:hypothetical protein